MKEQSSPQCYKYVYMYGIRKTEVLFIKKKGKKTWELPGGTIEPEEIPEETAKREFLEETGYKIKIVQSIETGEKGKIAFICKIGNKVANHDQGEIEEIKFFSCKQIPQRENLSYDTDYEKVLSEINRYIERR